MNMKLILTIIVLKQLPIFIHSLHQRKRHLQQLQCNKHSCHYKIKTLKMREHSLIFQFSFLAIIYSDLFNNPLILLSMLLTRIMII